MLIGVTEPVSDNQQFWLQTAKAGGTDAPALVQRAICAAAYLPSQLSQSIYLPACLLCYDRLCCLCMRCWRP